MAMETSATNPSTVELDPSSPLYVLNFSFARVPAADNDSPATLYDLLTAGDDHSTVVLTTITTQCSYVIGTSSEDSVEHGF